jgi:hypothetical protein
MLHVRVIAPEQRTERVLQELTGDEAVTHLVVLPGAARSPSGDVLEFDVVREGASTVIDRLRALGLDRDGAIVVERVDAA